MDRFCSLGLYDRCLKRFQRHFRRKMEVALGAMEASFPAATSWTKPVGGYTICVTMPKKPAAEDLLDHLAPSGVMVSPG